MLFKHFGVFRTPDSVVGLRQPVWDRQWGRQVGNTPWNSLSRKQLLTHIAKTCCVILPLRQLQKIWDEWYVLRKTRHVRVHRWTWQIGLHITASACKRTDRASSKVRTCNTWLYCKEGNAVLRDKGYWILRRLTCRQTWRTWAKGRLGQTAASQLLSESLYESVILSYLALHVSDRLVTWQQNDLELQRKHPNYRLDNYPPMNWYKGSLLLKQSCKPLKGKRNSQHLIVKDGANRTCWTCKPLT